jgi:hypothetical protein
MNQYFKYLEFSYLSYYLIPNLLLKFAYHFHYEVYQNYEYYYFEFHQMIKFAFIYFLNAYHA